MSDFTTLRGRQRQRSHQKHERILKAASEVFLEKGFDGANLDEIVRCAGVSRQTIYNHFGDKVSLFRAICADLTDEVTSILIPTNAGELDTAAVLHRVGIAFLDLVLRPTSLALQRMIIAETARFPDLGPEIYEAGGARSISALARWLDERTVRHELQIDDTVSAAEDFFALVRGNRQIRALLGVPVEQSGRESERVVARAVRIFMNAHKTS